MADRDEGKHDGVDDAGSQIRYVVVCRVRGI